MGSESNALAASGTLSALSRVSLPTDGAGLASGNQSKWLGRLGSQVDKSPTTPETVSLQLAGLAPGTQYNVAFDLLIGDSWDGSASGYGPDRWSLTVSSGGTGATLVDATFSSCGVDNGLCGALSPQTYSDATPLGGAGGTTFAPETGADAFFDSSGVYSEDYGIYWFGHGAGNPMPVFTADASTATLLFQRLPGTTDSADEYWALDNIVVTGTVVPLPAGAWLFGSAVAGLLGLARRKS